MWTFVHVYVDRYLGTYIRSLVFTRDYEVSKGLKTAFLLGLASRGQFKYVRQIGVYLSILRYLSIRALRAYLKYACFVR